MCVNPEIAELQRVINALMALYGKWLEQTRVVLYSMNREERAAALEEMASLHLHMKDLRIYARSFAEQKHDQKANSRGEKNKEE